MKRLFLLAALVVELAASAQAGWVNIQDGSGASPILFEKPIAFNVTATDEDAPVLFAYDYFTLRYDNDISSMTMVVFWCRGTSQATCTKRMILDWDGSGVAGDSAVDREAFTGEDGTTSAQRSTWYSVPPGRYLFDFTGTIAGTPRITLDPETKGEPQ